jgi:multidrug resistance efflux pump
MEREEILTQYRLNPDAIVSYIEALEAQNKAKDARIEALEAQNKAKDARIEALEAQNCQRRFTFPQFGRFKIPHLQI